MWFLFILTNIRRLSMSHHVQRNTPVFRPISACQIIRTASLIPALADPFFGSWVYTVKESTRPHEKLDSICTPPAKHRNADLLCSVGIHGLRTVKQCQLWFCRLFKASRSHPWGMRYCILWSWRQKCILDLAPINWTQCAFLCLADGERWAAWWEMLYGLGF